MKAFIDTIKFYEYKDEIDALLVRMINDYERDTKNFLSTLNTSTIRSNIGNIHSTHKANVLISTILICNYIQSKIISYIIELDKDLINKLFGNKEDDFRK